MKNTLKQEKGITLIALVITIIVLLILAGVVIATLSGENGILNRAGQSSVDSEIAQIEEQANLIYMEKMANTISSGNMTLAEVATELTARGYNVQSASTGSGVTGITLTPSSVSVETEGTATITVSYTEGTGETNYYTVVKGNHYLMQLRTDGIRISRTPTQIEGGGETPELAATSNDTNVVEASVNGTAITLLGKTTGSATVTVSYGTITQTCAVTVTAPAPVINYGGKTKTEVTKGDTITIGDEQFMVLKNSSGTIMAMPYYNLMIKNNPTEIKQATAETASSAGTIAFSGSAYWNTARVNINMSGANKIQQYITSYQTYLQGLAGSSVTAEVGRFYDDSISTGWNISSFNGQTNSESKKLLNPSGVGPFWLGSSGSSNASYVSQVSSSRQHQQRQLI